MPLPVSIDQGPSAGANGILLPHLAVRIQQLPLVEGLLYLAGELLHWS